MAEAKPAAGHETTTNLGALPTQWEVVVVGAGVAGATAALHLARKGLRVLLVDRQQFPRYKVCGCCLNARAVGELRRMGVDATLERAGALEIRAFQFMAGGRVARLPLRGGRVLSREALDQLLVQQAVSEGAQFLQGVRAQLDQVDAAGAVVSLRDGTESLRVQAAAVVCAQGLHDQFMAAQNIEPPKIARAARIGMGVVLPASDALEAGVIYMAAGAQGYVGMVRLEDGRTNVAAALDIQATRALGSGRTIQAILETAGAPAPGSLLEAAWKGTPALTRSRAPAWNRIFFVGDAAGYVEPFTGEGMAWALAGGVAVAEHAERLMQGATAEEERWAAHWRALVARRQYACRGLAWVLRHPGLTRLAVRALALQPALARPFVRSIHTERQEVPR
jgi:menaquinone-9 beta-reductase